MQSRQHKCDSTIYVYDYMANELYFPVQTQRAEKEL
jgi:hypothetical protein